MNKQFYLVLLLLSLINTLNAAELATGEYISENGWGVMTITKANQFSINTIGGNGHSCSLEGSIEKTRAVLEAAESNKPCIINFAAKGDAIEVSSQDSELCRFFCGMRADFEGLYLKPKSGCSTQQIEKTRKRFNNLYQTKNYQQANETLEPLLINCAKTLDWLDEGRIRNDLAVTQYHLGLLQQCQKTLEPINNSVGKTGEPLPKTQAALKALLPPTDFENYLPIAKATWHNWGLCTQKKAE
jgi:hypothetical protein